ncbi:MAG: hypothetical protein BRC36_06415, partial [Cyanobacteria bacterium QH_2_48_84]
YFRWKYNAETQKAVKKCLAKNQAWVISSRFTTTFKLLLHLTLPLKENFGDEFNSMLASFKLATQE